MNIEVGWRKSNGEKIENLKDYILHQIESRKVSNLNNSHDLEIMIGTDAMLKTNGKRNRVVSFMTVIVFKKGNTGCHVITRPDSQPINGYTSTSVKLNGEIDRTINLAFWMRENVSIDPHVHLDLNPNPSFGSYKTYEYIKGYFENCGFENVEYKPNAVVASIAADHFL